MDFSRYTCWRSEQVGVVLDTEALQVSDAAFNATHHPPALYRRNEFVDQTGITTDETKPSIYSEQEFLRDISAPGVDWMFVPVLGSAGSGKSHLVRWLSTRITDRENRRVLLIPKTDTNLKDIIERILALCPGERFEPYRARLREATADLNPTQARTRLLNHLAEFVGPNFRPAGEVLDEDFQYLVRKLPSYFYDPVFREQLLKDGGFLHRLTEHILGSNSTVERLTERRNVVIGDLPHDLADVQNASDDARRFYRTFVGQPRVQENAIAWINKNLDSAIAELLRFRGEDLRQLMRAVRESLAEEGVELILLIEDFARLQGIDLQLLESFLERPIQPGRPPMCALRTVVAVNTDYFLKLPDTARQRVSFHVDLDVPADLSERSTGDLTVAFASRYLNAIRMSAPDLETWFEEHKEDSSAVSTACSTLECPHVETCHEAFGAHAGFGLYPFNRESLIELLRRVSGGKGFNARRLVKYVLKQVLEDHTSALQDGRFPSRALLTAFGGSNLPLRVATELERRDPVHGDRRRALLEIYSDRIAEIGLHNLNAGIHQAFDLPLLPQTGEDLAVPTAPPISEAGPATVDRLAVHLDPLTAWGNHRAKMPQPLLNYIRPLIYHAVINHIAWDSEMLVKDRLASQTSHFRQRGIYFEDSGVERQRSAVSLSLPLPDESRTDTALAVQALIRFDHHKSWNYPEGSEDLMIYARHLDLWSEAVVRQFRRPVPSLAEDWDPVPAIVEILSIGSNLCRADTNSERSLAEELDAILSPPPSQVEGMKRTDLWAEIAMQYRRKAGTLRDLLLARVGCVKGGSRRVLSIDVSIIIPVIKRLRMNLAPKEHIPDGLPSEYEAVSQMRALIDRQISQAVAEERAAWLRWDQQFGSELRTSPDCRAFRERIRDFAVQATSAGMVPGGQLRSALEAAIEECRPAETDRLLKVLDRLNSASSEIEGFAVLSTDYLPILKRAQTLIEVARRFTTGVEQRLEDERLNLSVEADKLNAECSALRDAASGTLESCALLQGEALPG